MEYDKPIKTSVSLSPKVVEKIDSYAEELGLNRSATISVLVNQAFNYQEQVKEVAEFNKNFAKYSEDMKKALGGLKKVGKKE